VVTCDVYNTSATLVTRSRGDVNCASTWKFMPEGQSRSVNAAAFERSR
jgi:hypothetical protein